MGGRWSKEARIINQMNGGQRRKGSQVSTDLSLPNRGGDHSAGIVRDAPAKDADIANKKYVDERVATASQPGHTHNSLAASDGTPDPALSVDADGNVGIGTANPGASLEVASGQILAPAGSDAAPAYSFRDDTDTGFASTGGNTFKIITTGVERFRFAGSGFRGVDGTESLPAWSFQNDVDTGVRRITVNKMALVTGGSDRLVVDASGNVVVEDGNLTVQNDINLIKDGTSGVQQIDVYGGGVLGRSAFFMGRKAQGTKSSPSEVNANDLLFSLAGRGYKDSGAFSGFDSARIQMYATETFTDSAQGTKIIFGTTPQGSTSVATRLTIGSDGTLDHNTTTGALLVPRMTTTQRDALTAANGMIIYNTSTNAFNFYENGSWVTK